MANHHEAFGRWIVALATVAFLSGAALEPLFHPPAMVGSTVTPVDAGDAGDSDRAPTNHDETRCVVCKAGAAALPGHAGYAGLHTGSIRGAGASLPASPVPAPPLNGTRARAPPGV
ncbi:MAG: hypothetical protein WD737_07845 [Gemmatimonadota bacterium]